MTLKELIETFNEMEIENYLNYEIKYFNLTQDGIENAIPIKAIGISTDKEILLSNKCPNCGN